MGVACIIVAYFVITHATDYDGFTANADSIYRVPLKGVIPDQD
ncbi:MAG: hypothetical protein OEW00_09770 [candidate division Zixibacteria bacterium]|nr:hypothetical protein [candidate division Zixibacteria bacterium]